MCFSIGLQRCWIGFQCQHGFENATQRKRRDQMLLGQVKQQVPMEREVRLNQMFVERYDDAMFFLLPMTRCYLLIGRYQRRV